MKCTQAFLALIVTSISLVLNFYCHQKCFAQYLQNHQLLKAPPESKTKQGSNKRTVFLKYYEFIKDVLARGNGVSLSEIRDLVKSEEEIDLQNSEVKMFLEESFGNQIQFCDSDKKNQSSFVFSSSVDIKDALSKTNSEITNFSPLKFFCLYWPIVFERFIFRLWCFCKSESVSNFKKKRYIVKTIFWKKNFFSQCACCQKIQIFPIFKNQGYSQFLLIWNVHPSFPDTTKNPIK